MQADQTGDCRPSLSSNPNPSDATDSLSLAAQQIDDRFGQGYVARHPEVLAALIQAHALKDAAHALKSAANAMESVARSLNPVACVGGKQPAPKSTPKTPQKSQAWSATKKQKRCIEKQFRAMGRTCPPQEWFDALTFDEADAVIKDCLNQLPRGEV